MMLRRKLCQLHGNIDQHLTFMKLALRHAQAAYREKEIPIGAVLVNEIGVVVSVGRSKMESYGDPNAQAEVICLSLARKLLSSNSLSNCSLYTTFEPLTNSYDLIDESNIQNIYFGAKDFSNGAFTTNIQTLSERFNRIKYLGGLRENDSRNLIDSFFRARKRESPSKIFLSDRGLPTLPIE